MRKILAGFAVLFMLHSAHVSAQVPAEAEARLRGIYERGELDARSFRQPWLPDGAGYTALEAPAGANERELVTYDATSGQRTVLGSLAQLIPPGGTEPLAIESYTFSPDESWLLLQTSRNDPEGRVDVYWKLERASGTLRRVVAGGSNRISPDGQRILYAEQGNLHVYDLQSMRLTF